MKKTILHLTIAILLCYSVSVSAQPTITFYPSDGTTLTRQDVDNTLEAHGLTRESEFHAVIEVATEIGFISYTNCSVLTVKSNTVIHIGEIAFSNSRRLYSVNFPNAKTIGKSAFAGCWLFFYSYFPNVTHIGTDAFGGASRFIYIPVEMSFPKVVFIDTCAFNWFDALRVLSLGTAHTEPTTIKFGPDVFLENGTRGKDLILGSYVLPKPDLDNLLWNDDCHDSLYSWRTIRVIDVGIKESELKISIIKIDENIYYIADDIITNFSLYDILGRQIRSYSNERIIDLNALPNGNYFLSNNKTHETISLIKN